MAIAAASPCNGNCALNVPLGLCEGCMRTKEEIVAWPTMQDEQRRMVMVVVEQRKQKLGRSPVPSPLVG
jgi:uncharacterized protein